MTTKEQERKALEQNRKIVSELGEDSYIGAAFEGCFEIAESNIENDWACSMKQRAEAAEQKADAAEQKAEALGKKQAELMAKVEKLEASLDRELEWKPWTPDDAFSQQRYDELKRSGHEMTDAEAKRWVCDEFGFDYDRIRINRKMNTFEVNRHHQLRKSGEIDRDPYYDATDWYYVFFTVCGMDYEAHDGTFRRI